MNLKRAPDLEVKHRQPAIAKTATKRRVRPIFSMMLFLATQNLYATLAAVCKLLVFLSLVSIRSFAGENDLAISCKAGELTASVNVKVSSSTADRMKGRAAEVSVKNIKTGKVILQRQFVANVDSWPKGTVVFDGASYKTSHIRLGVTSGSGFGDAIVKEDTKVIFRTRDDNCELSVDGH